MRSPSSREADPQNCSQLPSGPPNARTRMSRGVAARRVTTHLPTLESRMR